MDPDKSFEPASDKPSGGWSKFLLFVGFVAVSGLLLYLFGDSLRLQNLAQHEASLRDTQRECPVLMYGIVFLVYVLVTGLGLPLATGMSLVIGWFFGFVPGVLLVSFASTAGATISFTLSRYLLRDSIQRRFEEQLVGFNKALEREGAFYLFTLRLIPVVPFFAINLVMGLTSIRTWTFWWVSQVGMLAGTCVYVFAGASVPDLQTLVHDEFQLPLRMWIAFILLGGLPLLTKRLQTRLRSQ